MCLSVNQWLTSACNGSVRGGNIQCGGGVSKRMAG